MPALLELEATVSSKGQITLPAALRARLGLIEGSKVKFTCDGERTTFEAELPISAYRGFLKPYKLPPDIADIPKEPDRF
jgi:AbrB family looped-hinge helix DNA binding protein